MSPAQRMVLHALAEEDNLYCCSLGRTRHIRWPQVRQPKRGPLTLLDDKDDIVHAARRRSHRDDGGCGWRSPTRIQAETTYYVAARDHYLVKRGVLMRLR